MKDKVIIIVPAYNVEEYIERSIESLKQQTYQNIEIIIINDCSTDNTWEKCQELKCNSSNIVLLNHETNQGQEATREDGLKVASGEWIMFLDADDTFSTDGIEKVMMLSEKYKPDWILCPYTKIVKGKRHIRSCTLKQGLYNSTEFTKKLFINIPLDVLSCIGSKVYKKSFLLENNLHFDRQYKYNEDGAFVYGCLESSDKILFADIPYYQYWIRSSGSSETSYRENMFITISKADDYLRRIITRNGCFSGEVRDGYYMRRAAIMLDSLVNETKFKDFNSFRRTAAIVRNNHDFEKLHDVISNIKGNKGVKVMFGCLRCHANFILYCLLRLKTRL